jgi:type I restriction enzyme, S subunit
LYHLFNQKSVREVIQAKATGTKVRHTSPTKLDAIEACLPPISIQKNFADIVDKLWWTEGIHSKSQEVEDSLFFSLQQRAFAGEL